MMIKKLIKYFKEKEVKKDIIKRALNDKAKLMMINDKVDEYRKGGNAYTILRDITNITKGW